LNKQARLIVEADGGQHAAAPHDAARDAWFRHQGFTVARYWNSDILTNPDGVLASLLERSGADQETAR
jgi:very-short-patch-repair endonuclease